MSKSRQIVIFVVAIVALFVLIEAIGKPQPVPRDAPSSVPATVVNDYPADALVNFEASCRQQGGSVATCVCLIHGMENRYTYTKFQALVAADNPKAPEYAVVAQDCAGK